MERPAAAAPPLRRTGPACVLCTAPAATYNATDDAFLCTACDSQVNSAAVQSLAVTRVPTATAQQAQQQPPPLPAEAASLARVMSLCLQAVHGAAASAGCDLPSPQPQQMR